MKTRHAVLSVLLAAALPAVAQVSASEEAAAQKIATTVCASCHGADGNSSEPTVPKLAGQQERYLLKQLKDYIAGKRKNAGPTPCGPDLNPAGIAGLAAWFGKQKASPGKPGDPALSAEGRKLYELGNNASDLGDCLQCHETGGKGSGLYPKLAGQHGAYLVKQLNAFKTLARRNDKNEMMHDVAEVMAEQEMLAIAEYLKGL